MNDQTPVAADHLQRAAERLARASDTPRLDAEVLLRHVLGTDRTGLILRLQSPVPVEAASAFEALVVARLGGQPVAYLTGHREFLGLDFAVGPGVLIPRPETELLVERALAWLSSRDTLAAGRPESTVRILDVGTGSGAIALSLATLSDPDRPLTIVATDISSTALGFARRNAAGLDPLHRVRLVRCDLAEALAGPFDLVLANLPYLTPGQIASSPSIAAEPPGALLGGDDGLELLRRLIPDLPRLLARDGAAGLEIDPAQADSVQPALQTVLSSSRVEVIRDLAGHARHLWLQREGNETVG